MILRLANSQLLAYVHEVTGIQMFMCRHVGGVGAGRRHGGERDNSFQDSTLAFVLGG